MPIVSTMRLDVAGGELADAPARPRSPAARCARCACRAAPGSAASSARRRPPGRSRAPPPGQRARPTRGAPPPRRRRGRGAPAPPRAPRRSPPRSRSKWRSRQRSNRLPSPPPGRRAALRGRLLLVDGSSSLRASEGTSVRESRYEASIARTTASASGVNRNRAGPVSSTTGKNTMQMVRVAASAGTAICCAPSRRWREVERLAVIRTCSCGGCSPPRPWRRPPACRWPAPARPAS